jgi:histidinol phosphatase-like PHP family hydrolase
MTWQPTDCHAHTRHSDGALTVAEVIARATSLGVRPSISDHVSTDAPTTVDSLPAIDVYLTDLERFDVLRGGEFCWHDALWRELTPALTRRFTHRLGSLHAIRLADGTFFRAFNPVLPRGLTAAQYMEAHVSSLEALAAEMPVDILSHPTLVPPPLRAEDPETLWTEGLEERAVRALRGAGIAFEVSARYVPHERLVRRMVDGNVRLALGSDGHSREQVANIVEPLATARRLGVPDEALYDPAVHGSRTGFYAATARRLVAPAHRP